MTDTDQLIDEIIKSINDVRIELKLEHGYILKERIEDILRTHLAGKLILDRSKVEEMIESRWTLKLQTKNPVSETYIDMFIKDLQSILPTNKKQ